MELEEYVESSRQRRDCQPKLYYDRASSIAMPVAGAVTKTVVAQTFEPHQGSSSDPVSAWGRGVARKERWCPAGTISKEMMRWLAEKFQEAYEDSSARVADEQNLWADEQVSTHVVITTGRSTCARGTHDEQALDELLE